MNTTNDFVALADLLGVNDSDVLIVGDGSGTRPGNPVGWAAKAYSFATGSIYTWTGALSDGTNNVAELMPALQALTSLSEMAKLHERRRTLKADIVSDSEVTVKHARREYRRGSNLVLWSCLDTLEGLGWCLRWHWVPRNSNPVNTWADGEAKLMRGMLLRRNSNVDSAGL